MKRIVIFDMDGTLIDSRKDITISVNYVRRVNHNLPPLSEEFIVNAINKKERNLAYLFYGTKVYEERDRELFEKHYHKQCIEHPYLFDGIKQVLYILKKKDVLMGVATNAPTKFAVRILEHLGVADLFVKIVGADAARPKPDPDMVMQILQTCNYETGEDQAWMVGDNQKDIEVAQRSGIEAIYATWGFQSEVKWPLKAHHPKEILDIVL